MTRRLSHPTLPPGPMALGAVAAVVALLAGGVRPLEILGFAGYQGVFVLAPGLLLLRALLRGRGSPLTQLAIGYPLGYAAELSAFMVTAALGARWLFFLYPPLVCGLALWASSKRSRDAGTPSRSIPPGPAWATAAVVTVAVALLGLGFFATNPLPRSVPSVALYTDTMFHVALAADARHHWPVSDPNASGEPVRYHLFVHVEAAAVNQVTGIDLDVIMLRLQLILIMLLVGVQLGWLAARVARGSPWVAPGAVAITLLAAELDLDIDRASPFTGLFFQNFPVSPTFAFGLPFFIAALGMLTYVLSRARSPERGTWVVLGALLGGAMGAKATTLPVLLVALGVFIAARAALDRTIDRRAVAVLGVVFGIFGAVYVALYSGAGDFGGTRKLFGFLDFAIGEGAFSGPVKSFLGDAAQTLALIAPWLGGLLLIGHVRGLDRTVALWLGAVALGACAPFVVFSQPGFSQVYFLAYGAPAASVLSAWGIARAWPADRPRGVALAAFGAALAALLVVILLHERTAGVSGLPAGYMSLYGLLIALVLVVAVGAGRSPRAVFAWGVPLLVAVCLLDTPLDVLPDWAEKARAGDAQYVTDSRDGPRGTDTELVAGLRWLRDNSDASAVVATDLGTETPAGQLARARDSYPAALAERRMFLGGWDYTKVGVIHVAEARPGIAFEDRRALTRAAFAGEPAALRTLRRRYGVRFLLSDLRHGNPAPALDRALPLAYGNPAVRIYRLR